MLVVPPKNMSVHKFRQLFNDNLTYHDLLHKNIGNMPPKNSHTV